MRRNKPKRRRQCVRTALYIALAALVLYASKALSSTKLDCWSRRCCASPAATYRAEWARLAPYGL